MQNCKVIFFFPRKLFEVADILKYLDYIVITQKNPLTDTNFSVCISQKFFLVIENWDHILPAFLFKFKFVEHGLAVMMAVYYSVCLSDCVKSLLAERTGYLTFHPLAL